jgi:hypothetical protein
MNLNEKTKLIYIQWVIRDEGWISQVAVVLKT